VILGCLMTDESTTPDLIELTRSFYETMDREWDFDALAGFFAPDTVWDLSGSHLGIYEGVGAIGDFLVGYGRRGRTTITRSRGYSISATACCLSRSGKTVA
jgi:ketosteroid isomerase-like protein